MKKKNKLVIILSTIFVISLVFLVIFIFSYQSPTFTIEEKKWMEDNKNKVIDIALLNNVPALNYNGSGVIFDFLDEFEKEFGLTFNKSAYKIDDSVNNSYTFKLVDKKTDSDILVLRDNYVLVVNNNSHYNHLSDIKNLKLGVLKDDINIVLDESCELVEYSTTSELINSIKDLDGIIVLKTLVMEKLVKDNLTIGYQFNNYTKDYVISLNGNHTLNNIISKYYDEWYLKHYSDSYNEHLLKDYYTFKGISDSDQTNIKSRKYVYGFVENGIFDQLSSSNLKGINNLILKDFKDFSGVSITYQKYSNNNELFNDFNNNKIDLFLNNTNFIVDSNVTRSGIDSTLVVISKINNNIVIDSVNDLQNKNIGIVQNSNIESYFNNVNFTKYPNISNMIKHENLMIIDLENYNYYKSTSLADYKIDYVLDINNTYKYVVNKDEKIFADLFDFYVNYVSVDQVISDGYKDIAYKTVNYLYILIIIIILLVVFLSLFIINKFKRMMKNKKKRKHVNLSKADKLKYIDQLTSLKNRAYLNSKIDEWDNSEVYPQSIIIVDLNNISYINDNYGREEGDNVIIEAANILINSQLPNSEIIRTDGDEFLIYLVGYTEKNVISYLRSLSREFKHLSHGFGAASGYSMITDGIKTVDDAVNEATIDMKNNKEDINY